MPKLQKSANTQNAQGAAKKSINFSGALEKLTPRSMNSHLVSEEINLVPDIKNEMIKTLKLRNFVFFLSIVVATASVVVILIFASIAGGQQAIADGKKTTIDNLSAKLSSYSDLSDFLTIKDQLSNVSSITDNKKLLSRTFGILSALLPSGSDTITISELNIDLTEESPTISFDAQANAGNPPYIDYNVLDSFKKSMQYMRYDYGTYVDKEGAEIPSYCIIENGTNGATLSDPEKGYYAYWLITGEGCNPSYSEEDAEDVLVETITGTDTTTDATTDATNEAIAALKLAAQTAGYTTEEYNGQTVVKIWRTPQYSDWYKENPKSAEPSMTLDGTISNVAHFESQCITYQGYDSTDYTPQSEETLLGKENGITWVSKNSTCLLVPDGIDGINISDSSNGRGSSGDLVLRFSATIALSPEVYSFNNKHVLALAPSGRYNVTDSYVQVQSMFSERAADCAPGDTACNSNGGN